MKAIKLISTIALSVMLAGTACADRQDYDAPQGKSDQTDAAEKSKGTQPDSTQKDNSGQQQSPQPTDENAPDQSAPVLPVPMQ